MPRKRKYSKRRSEMTPEEREALDAHNLEILSEISKTVMYKPPADAADPDETADPKRKDVASSGNSDSALM